MKSNTRRFSWARTVSKAFRAGTRKNKRNARKG